VRAGGTGAGRNATALLKRMTLGSVAAGEGGAIHATAQTLQQV